MHMYSDDDNGSSCGGSGYPQLAPALSSAAGNNAADKVHIQAVHRIVGFQAMSE